MVKELEQIVKLVENLKNKNYVKKKSNRFC
jgi:hypothetical protein